MANRPHAPRPARLRFRRLVLRGQEEDVLQPARCPGPACSLLANAVRSSTSPNSSSRTGGLSSSIRRCLSSMGTGSSSHQRLAAAAVVVQLLRGGQYGGGVEGIARVQGVQHLHQGRGGFFRSSRMGIAQVPVQLTHVGNPDVRVVALGDAKPLRAPAQQVIKPWLGMSKLVNDGQGARRETAHRGRRPAAPRCPG